VTGSERLRHGIADDAGLQIGGKTVSEWRAFARAAASMLAISIILGGCFAMRPIRVEDYAAAPDSAIVKVITNDGKVFHLMPTRGDRSPVIVEDTLFAYIPGDYRVAIPIRDIRVVCLKGADSPNRYLGLLLFVLLLSIAVIGFATASFGPFF
jgi:hypothetical protein